MRLLVLEFITGGGMLGNALPKSLVSEAQQMLNAIINDLQEIGSIKILVLSDSRLENNRFNDSQTIDQIIISQKQQFDTVWQKTIREVDAVLIIAPETHGILSRLCIDVERAGTLLLNSSRDAVSIASSKIKTSQRLSAANIPVIATHHIDESSSSLFPLVIKPDDGVGCESMFFITDQACLELWIESFNPENMVIQPWISGQAASLSVIFSETEVEILTYNRQLIEVQDGRFIMSGCRVGDQTQYWDIYQTMVRQISDNLPGLRGYVGIDVIETSNGPVVLEINPRLTTSYAGIRQAIHVNPALLILKSFNLDFSDLAIRSDLPTKPVTINLQPLQ